MLTKRWSVLVDNRLHEVVVSWNVLGSGGGLILVDGVEVSRWLVGVKWPGVEKRFGIEGRDAHVVQHTVGDYQLQVEGMVVPNPSRIPPSAEARRLNRMGMLVLLGPIVGLLVLGAAIAILAATR